MNHFTKSKNELFDEYQTRLSGLTEKEVKEKRIKYGENKFRDVDIAINNYSLFLWENNLMFYNVVNYNIIDI